MKLSANSIHDLEVVGDTFLEHDKNSIFHTALNLTLTEVETESFFPIELRQKKTLFVLVVYELCSKHTKKSSWIFVSQSIFMDGSKILCKLQCTSTSKATTSQFEGGRK